MSRWIGALAGCFLALAANSAVAQAFDGWASAFIAGDWRDGQGQPIKAFDNARRDLSLAFQAAGFPEGDMVSVSLGPDADAPTSTEMLALFQSAATRAQNGCLFYVTSHGSPAGVVFGPEATLAPEHLISLMRRLCGARPTVVVVSACFSGVFVDGLKAPNRMVMTAARRDRSSFGCGTDAVYPYFDECVLKSLPDSADFIALSRATKTCVAAREEDEGLSPPSEPQTFVGAEMQLLLPTLRFRPTAGDRSGS